MSHILNEYPGRARVQPNIKNILIVTKAHDNKLIKLTRELALCLMHKHRRGSKRGLVVFVFPLYKSPNNSLTLSSVDTWIVIYAIQHFLTPKVFNVITQNSSVLSQDVELLVSTQFRRHPRLQPRQKKPMKGSFVTGPTTCVAVNLIYLTLSSLYVFLSLLQAY